jgi:hypothetical protein
MSDKPICVLAGNWRQFINWCHETGLHPQREAHYCSGVESIIGWEFEEFTKVGTWWDATQDATEAFERKRLTYRVIKDIRAGNPIDYVRIT